MLAIPNDLTVQLEVEVIVMLLLWLVEGSIISELQKFCSSIVSNTWYSVKLLMCYCLSNNTCLLLDVF